MSDPIEQQAEQAWTAGAFPFSTTESNRKKFFAGYRARAGEDERRVDRFVETIKELDVRADRLEAERDEALEAKDIAYAERNKFVAAMAGIAIQLGWRAGLGRHEGDHWEDDWRNIVFIDLPTGQASWHIHDSEFGLFSFLPPYEGRWDGHSTEEKYERLAAIARAENVPSARAKKLEES